MEIFVAPGAKFSLRRFYSHANNRSCNTPCKILGMKPKLTIRVWLQRDFAEWMAAFLVLLLVYTAIVKIKDHPRFSGAILHNPLVDPYAVALS
jgi:hypothetical protein